MVERQPGNLATARGCGTRALRLAHRRGGAWMIPYCRNGLAAIDAATGDQQRAVLSLAAAQRLSDSHALERQPPQPPEPH